MWSLDRASFQIVSFFSGVAHREGLSGKNAVGNYAAEQLALFHSGKQEADGLLLIGQLTKIVIAVNVVDVAGMFLHVTVKEVLQNTDSQFALAPIQNDRTAFFSDIPLDRETVFAAHFALQCAEQGFGVGAEQNSVNRLEHLCLIVDIFQFHKGKSCGMIGQISAGVLLFPEIA